MAEREVGLIHALYCRAAGCYTANKAKRTDRRCLKSGAAQKEAEGEHAQASLQATTLPVFRPSRTIIAVLDSPLV